MRVKLFVEGKEVDRRYLGSRLLWRSDGEIYKLRATQYAKRFQKGFEVGVAFFKGHPEDVVGFKIGNKEVFWLKKEKFKASPHRMYFFISEDEPGIAEYLGLEDGATSKSFTGITLYGF